MAYAELNGCWIYYEVKGEGPPLVFVHGGFGGLGTGLTTTLPPAWRDSFAERFQVITYDRRSAGRSGYPIAPHSQELFAADIMALLDHLGLARAAVWGTFGGGPPVMTFAARYPNAVTSLIVTETATCFFPDAAQRQLLKDRIAILESAGPEAAYDARRTGGTVGLNVFAADRPIATGADDEARKARQLKIQADLAAIPREVRVAKYAGELRNYSAYADFDNTDRIGEITSPTLVIQGTKDSMFPGFRWEPLIEHLPNFEFVALEGGEHGSVSSDPACLERVAAFVRGHADSPARAGQLAGAH